MVEMLYGEWDEYLIKVETGEPRRTLKGCCTWRRRWKNNNTGYCE